MDYEKRVVCFLDILGFKKMILDSENDSVLRQKIYDCLSTTNENSKLYNQNRKYSISVASPSAQDLNSKIFDLGIEAEMSFFSDSIILSYKMNQMRGDLSDLKVILHEICSVAYQLLRIGFFVRGGLTYGQIIHKGNICFGPALVNAVILESKAVFPRIMISPSFFDENSPDSVYYGRKNIIARNKEYWDELYHCVDASDLSLDISSNISSLRRSYDLVHYLDILDEQINGDIAAALHLKSIIEKELSAHHPDHIAEKYEWFKKYFNSIVCDVQCMNEARIEI